MTRARRFALGIFLVLLALALAGSYRTRGAMESLPFLHRAGGAAAGLSGGQDVVDQTPWKTAQALAGLAVSAEERQYAREAERLADHEVDQAFAQALRQASAEPRVLVGEALAAEQREKELEATVKQDQAAVTALTARAGPVIAGAETPQSDNLAEARAQLSLDQDELTAASVELSRRSGDPRVKIQQELTAREALMKAYDAQVGSGQEETAVVAAGRYNTLAGQISAWNRQRSRRLLLSEAQGQAERDVARLGAEQGRVRLGAASSAVAGVAGQRGRVKDLEHRAAQQNILNILNDRLATGQQLVKVYAAWARQVDLQHRIVLHLILQSVVLIAAILLLTLLAGWGLGLALPGFSHDVRQRETLRTVLNLGTQGVGLVLVLLVIFGVPRQMPTILGLATAGLTVVFQDFILAFCGWFVLMGRNGIRVGDWVEIDGVGGEVASVGVFRTWLLETGNWTANGHPTGRRVSFLNGFAIKSKYFNFSTAGQWMWDEIKVNLPAGADTYGLIEEIREAAVTATEGDAKMAEQEWKRLTHEAGVPQFSAEPSVSMRPAGAGVDVVVRYVTRAGVRLETRNRLFGRVVELLLGPSPTELAGGR